MPDRQHPSWIQQLIGILPWQADRRRTPVLSADEIIQLAAPTEQRRSEDWRDLLQPGRRVRVAWVADGEQPAADRSNADQSGVAPALPDAVTVPGEVRLIAGETFWVWFDCDVPRERCPEVGQALQVLVSAPDSLRLVPCRVIEEGRGGSLQLTVSGRLSRVQRRDHVRARVDLPPVSAVRLDADDEVVGLVGVRLLDLSAGGVRFQTHEPLRSVERLRLVLRLDDGPPLTPTVEVVEPGVVARGRFSVMPERERRRIVQFVYRQELAERREPEPANSGE
jgi:hypothetical protein